VKRIVRSKASDEWRTPPDVFAALHDEFDFDIDLAATAANHLLPSWYGPGSTLADGEDALTVPWSISERGRGFLNPPYSAALIGPFVRKAAEEARAGFTTVALVKLDPSTQWWAWTRSATEIREVPCRVPFLKADGASAAGAMFPSAVVVFRPQPGIVRAQPRRVVWTWKTQKATP
jgi:phage N-6-adenine-methyltransferase